jgi:hypothetical protein
MRYSCTSASPERAHSASAEMTRSASSEWSRRSHSEPSMIHSSCEYPSTRSIEGLM